MLGDKELGVVVLQLDAQDVRGAGFQHLALAEDPAFAADKLGAIRRLVIRAEHRQLHAVGVAVFEAELLGRIVNALVAAFDFGGTDFDRCRVIHARAPLRHIHKVRTPVGDVAGGILINPAEVEMTARRRVRSLRRAAHPHLVIEMRWHSLWTFKPRKTPTHRKRPRHADFDLLQLADVAVAYQFAGHAHLEP